MAACPYCQRPVQAGCLDPENQPSPSCINAAEAGRLFKQSWDEAQAAWDATPQAEKDENARRLLAAVSTPSGAQYDERSAFVREMDDAHDMEASR